MKLSANSAQLVERWRAEKDENRDVCSVHKTCPCMCCWDETDDGIPPCCKTAPGDEGKPVPCYKFFNEDNSCTNRNAMCWLFGTIGFQMFDKRRRVFMGLAMWTTLVSIFFAFLGALAYSDNHKLLYSVPWFEVSVRNISSVEKSMQVYLGLHSMMVVERPCNPVDWCKESM